MLNARIELRGEELFCADTGEAGISTVRRLTRDNLARLEGWAERYDAAVRTTALPPLIEIGRDIAAFLDEGDRWLDRVLGGTIGDIELDIAVPGQPEERERILLDTPWELLAPNGRFLAAGDDERLFRVARRLGSPGIPATPEFRDISLLFMAAEVEGQGVLDYEQEEVGILQATTGLPLNIMVAESGSIEFLGQRIAQDGPFEALHLSCHGDIVKGHPVLALETPEGGLDLVGIVPLSRAFGEEDKKPKLVFLSACRTGEHGAAAAFVQSLVRSGVANAIGWDGSVNDADAISFAATFYEELARGRSVAYAAARARGALLRAHLVNPDRGRHWHLARAYSGPRGGGALCASARPRRVFRRDAGYREFLDLRQRRVPVASAAEFVGRRHEAQRILRAFRDREGAGVLIHGLGRQGKSSLAARIANRMPGHDTVVIYERYEALAVFEALRNALPARLQRDFDQTWREQVTKDASNLQNALLDMLEGPFRTADPATRAKPVLLIIDDLEQILESPKPGEAGTPVKTAYSVALASIIAAFRDAETESRLLLTSRYTFAVTDARGDDLAARLVPMQLPPMDETQRDKQMRAAVRLAGAHHASDTPDRAALETRIKEAANGNPGLQAILSRPMLSGDAGATIKAVEAVESYLKSGEIPEDLRAASDFFTHVSLTAFKEMLTPQETQQLRAATLFSVPVQRPVFAAAGGAASVKEPVRAIERLRGLGLIDTYSAAGAKEELAVNSLVRPLMAPLSEAESAQIAQRAIAPLYEGWEDANGGMPTDLRGLEAARLALLGRAPPDIVNASSLAAVVFLFRTLHQAEPALDLVLEALSALDRVEAVPNLHLLRHGADCAERLGQTEIQEMLLERGLAIQDGDPSARAMLLSARASRLIRTGQIKSAEQLLKEAAEVFESLGDVRGRAVTVGKIADILEACGQLDEALKIRNVEELPVYERLGDMRSRALTMGKIADVLQARGLFDEALKIRNEEELPVYELLGDVRERAVTMGKIADILRLRGQLDEALKICYEQQLPVFERLGDVHQRAVTMGKIADILQHRGHVDEALKIRKEEELPVYERLGDVRSRAVTMGKIADILQARGQLDEALKTLEEEVLPVMGRLGDVRERAVTMGRMADILQGRGQLNEALKIRTQDELPVYQRLGDMRLLAVTMRQIADILQALSQTKVTRISTEELRYLESAPELDFKLITRDGINISKSIELEACGIRSRATLILLETEVMHRRLNHEEFEAVREIILTQFNYTPALAQRGFRLLEAAAPAEFAARQSSSAVMEHLILDRELTIRMVSEEELVSDAISFGENGFGWSLRATNVQAESEAVAAIDLKLASEREGPRSVTLSADATRLNWGAYLIELRFLVAGREVANYRETVSNTPPPNPYLAGPPVRSADRFFGRSRVLHRIDALLPSSSIIVLGPRRSGKTSLLYRLQEIYSKKYVVLFYDLHGYVNSTKRLLRDIAADLAHRLRIRLPKNNRINLTSLRKKLVGGNEPPVLILLDEIRILERDITVALELRALAKWDIPRVCLIGAGTSRDLDALSTSEYGSAPFNEFTNEDLDQLSDEAARELIQRPILGYYRYEPPALQMLIELGAGRPFYLNLLARLALDGIESEGGRAISQRHVEAARRRAIYELGRWYREFCGELSQKTRAELGRFVTGERTVEGIAAAELRSAGLTIGLSGMEKLDPLFREWWNREDNR